MRDYLRKPFAPLFEKSGLFPANCGGVFLLKRDLSLLRLLQILTNKKRPPFRTVFRFALILISTVAQVVLPNLRVSR